MNEKKFLNGVIITRVIIFIVSPSIPSRKQKLFVCAYSQIYRMVSFKQGSTEENTPWF